MFGGSVCAGADLLPPAGEGWRSLAAVRDGNALPLVKPLAWGGTGIHPASLPAAAHASSKSSQRQRKKKQLNASTTPTQEHHPPWDGSIDLVEESSVPEGQAKSALAPIRRPPCARRATAPERANAFLFGPCTARFSFGKTKEKWGVHPGWTSPPAGADTTVAAVRRPLHACVHRPLPPSSGRSASDPWVA